MGLDDVRIGKRVERFRTQQQLTFRELGRRAGISHGWIKQLEAGQTPKPGIAMLQKVANGLKMSLNDLLEGEMDFIPEPEPANSNPVLVGLQVHLKVIDEVMPSALEPLVPIIAAIKEKAERDHKETERVMKVRQRTKALQSLPHVGEDEP